LLSSDIFKEKEGNNMTMEIGNLDKGSLRSALINTVLGVQFGNGKPEEILANLSLHQKVLAHYIANLENKTDKDLMALALNEQRVSNQLDYTGKSNKELRDFIIDSASNNFDYVTNFLRSGLEKARENGDKVFYCAYTKTIRKAPENYRIAEIGSREDINLELDGALKKHQTGLRAALLQSYAAGVPAVIESLNHYFVKNPLD
jgi:hypothetical protein